MFEYLVPIKFIFDILEKCYKKIRKMGPSRKKKLLGRELIKLLMQLQDVISDAEELFDLIANSKQEISQIGQKGYIGVLQRKIMDQSDKILSLNSLGGYRQLDELFKILMPELRDRLHGLLWSKGSALGEAFMYLRDIRIKMEEDTLIINQVITLEDIDDIKSWYEYTMAPDVKLLERIDEQKQIISELKEKTEELRKVIISIFDINDLIALTNP
ncbi:MAG: hypothetical protein AB1424_00525 [Thermodesulfobacteriota bacterium]